MRSPVHPAIALGASFVIALALAGGVLMAAGTGVDGVHAALQWTARFAFLLFWPAYAGGALAALFGKRFRPVQRAGRTFGLAFAAALSVHLSLVAWLCLIGAAPGLRTFVIFGIAAACVYLLALFSIGPLQRRLGPRGWWLLRVPGMHYVALAFADDFVKRPLAGGLGHALFYAPFAALAVIGPGLRLAAMTQRLTGGWRRLPSVPPTRLRQAEPGRR